MHALPQTEIVHLSAQERASGLARRWQLRNTASQDPLASREWVEAALETLHPGAALYLIRVFDTKGRLAGILPLVECLRDSTIRAEYPGASTLREPVRLPLDREDAAARLIAASARLPVPVVLDRLWLKSPTSLPRGPHLRGLWLSPACRPSRHMTLKGTFGDFIAGLSSRRRNDYRRALRKAERIGPVSTNTLLPENTRMLKTALTRAIGIEDRSWKGQQGSSLARRPALRAFFFDFLSRPAILPLVRLYFLRIGQQDAAMQIGLHTGDRLWMLKIGYDEQLRRVSPGMLMMMEVLRHNLESGTRGIEFLGSSEDWLSLWTREERTYASRLHYPLSLAGLRALGSDLGKHFLPGKQRARMRVHQDFAP
ncbi:MAG TPA: GNAT family N-acetyltransferase [Gammaproteobacteria bacterium]|nr:GNAT family N-acetyltransferase [Gammaproteobacteria bacterium]